MNAAENVHAALTAHRAPYPAVPLHVVGRIAALIGDGEPVQIANVSFGRPTDWRLAGTVVLLVDKRLICARFHDSANVDRWDEHDRSTVEVSVIGLSTITSISITAGVDRVNPDLVWQQDWGESLPRSAHVRIHTSGLAEPVLLPEYLTEDLPQEQRAALLELVRALSSSLS